MRPLPSRPRPQARPRRERGVIMVIALITLAVLLIGAAATMRSMNVSLLSAGNFGFKRDMANQSERAMRAAIDSFNSGSLSTMAARQANDPKSNYSATMLNSDPSGIPLVMLDMNSPDTFGGAGDAGNVIKLDTQGIQLHYLIDRLCNAAGAFNANNCLVSGRTFNRGPSLTNPLPAPQPTYRITVRVMGPHDAYSFYQSTFTTKN